MPSPQQDEGLAAATSNAISNLLDAHACNICHALLSAPVSLPCSHVFCSECVRRHLSATSRCPHPICRKPATYTQLTPLREYDIALEPLRRAGQKVEPAKLCDQKRLVFLSRKSCARTQLLERLRAHGISTNGGVDALAKRYNEFVIRWNANLDAGVPKSKKTIVAAVLETERGAEKEAKKPRGALAFFPRAALGEGDEDVPVEGDSFEMLVAKTRTRMRKRKRMTVNESSEKRVCVNHLKRASEVESGVHSELADGVNEGGRQDSQPTSNASPPHLDTSPVGTQEKPSKAPVITCLNPHVSEPVINAHVTSQSLTVSDAVCCLNFPSDTSGKGTGNVPPYPSVEAHPPTRHSIAGLARQGPLWSQTTPEKAAASVGQERDVGIRGGESAVPVPSTPLLCAGMFMTASSQPEDPHRKSKTTSTAPRPHPYDSPSGRPRTANSFDILSPDGSSLKISSHRPPPQTQSRNDTPEVARHPSQRTPTVGSDNVRIAPSGDITPTKEQLDRAERNRLAAIERRIRYYAQLGFSQMRQPEL